MSSQDLYFLDISFQQRSFAKTLADCRINNIADAVSSVPYYNSRLCFASSSSDSERWFAFFAGGEVYSSRISRYVNNLPCLCVDSAARAPTSSLISSGQLSADLVGTEALPHPYEQAFVEKASLARNLSHSRV